MNCELINNNLTSTKKVNRNVFYFYKRIKNNTLKKRFIEILKELNLYNGNSYSYLSDKDFYVVELIYNSLIYEVIFLKQQKKSKKKKTFKNNKHLQKETVYEKLTNSKNIGKLIRIRTK